MENVVSIDRESNEYFQTGWSRPFDIGDARLSNIRALDSIDRTPHADDTRFYPFNWGVIIERRLKKVIVWDFCIDSVQKLRNLQLLEQVKKHIFIILQNIMPEHVGHESFLLEDSSNRWMVYKGNSYSEFSIGVLVEHEDDARAWMGSDMLPNLIYEVIRSLYINNGEIKTPLTA